MEFLSLSRRRSSARNVPIGEERGETVVLAGYIFVRVEVGEIGKHYATMLNILQSK